MSTPDEKKRKYDADCEMRFKAHRNAQTERRAIYMAQKKERYSAYDRENEELERPFLEKFLEAEKAFEPVADSDSESVKFIKRLTARTRRIVYEKEEANRRKPYPKELLDQESVYFEQYRQNENLFSDAYTDLLEEFADEFYDVNHTVKHE